jgi:hypothetical protein
MDSPGLLQAPIRGAPRPKFAARVGKAIETIHFRPRYPDFLHGAPPTPARAAFSKESRMKSANASKLDRKSGVRFGEPGAPVSFLLFSSGPIKTCRYGNRAYNSQMRS